MNPEVLCYLSKTFSNFIGEYLKLFRFLGRKQFSSN